LNFNDEKKCFVKEKGKKESLPPVPALLITKKQRNKRMDCGMSMCLCRNFLVYQKKSAQLQARTWLSHWPDSLQNCIAGNHPLTHIERNDERSVARDVAM